MGIILGIGLGIFLAGIHLEKSNNFGDSTGELITFTDTGIIYTKKWDKCEKNIHLDDIDNPTILEELSKFNKKHPNGHKLANSLEDEMNNFEINTEINPFKPLS